jgi:TatD DNase family protein
MAVGPVWFDDHCHLTGLDGEVSDHVAAAAGLGVTRLLTVGTDVADSAAAVAIAERFEGVWATAGVHPHEARHGLEGLVELLDHPSVVAVGECGLDYYYDHSPRDEQQAVFEAQIALALEHDLALVIHTRDAWDDTFAVLDSVGVPPRTVFHCFTGGPAQAEACLERGAHLSFSGILTFPSADDVRQAARVCPPDRALLETDSPYLTPVPHRGRPNRPQFVPLVGARLAQLWDVPVAEVARATWDNGARLYRLPVGAPAPDAADG